MLASSEHTRCVSAEEHRSFAFRVFTPDAQICVGSFIPRFRAPCRWASRPFAFIVAVLPTRTSSPSSISVRFTTSPVSVSIGPMQWFLDLLAQLGIECQVGVVVDRSKAGPPVRGCLKSGMVRIVTVRLNRPPASHAGHGEGLSAESRQR